MHMYRIAARSGTYRFYLRMTWLQAVCYAIANRRTYTVERKRPAVVKRATFEGK